MTVTIGNFTRKLKKGENGEAITKMDTPTHVMLAGLTPSDLDDIITQAYRLRREIEKARQKNRISKHVELFLRGVTAIREIQTTSQEVTDE